MNIYAFTNNGETDWVLAKTVIQALQHLNSLNDLEIMDYDEDDDIKIIPKEEWSKKMISFKHEDESLEDISFEDHVKGITSPEVIATTCY